MTSGAGDVGERCLGDHGQHAVVGAYWPGLAADERTRPPIRDSTS